MKREVEEKIQRRADEKRDGGEVEETFLLSMN